MKRNIISIDEDKCTGCGLCIPGCPEGALQIIDGKARLVSDLFCDGLGACLGSCPEDAITVEEREAEAYDEAQTMENIVRQGPNVIRAHLEHLSAHGDTEHLREAEQVLQQKGLPNPLEQPVDAGTPRPSAPSGCPGARSVQMAQKRTQPSGDQTNGPAPSELTHWPIQLHLISPAAPQYRGSDVLLCADCVAYALGDFHETHLKGKALTIACPKLDQGREVYLRKITSLIDQAAINTLTVMIMHVPCCRGLLQIATDAVAQAARRIPVKCVVVDLQGAVLSDEWLSV